MLSPLDRLMVDALDAYLGGDIDLDRFEEWFYPASLGVHVRGNEEAIALAGGVKLRLAEFKNEHWTEPELRQRLEELRPWVRISTAMVKTTTASASRVAQHTVALA
jgi:hypothetical protein